MAKEHKIAFFFSLQVNLNRAMIQAPKEKQIQEIQQKQEKQPANTHYIKVLERFWFLTIYVDILQIRPMASQSKYLEMTSW